MARQVVVSVYSSLDNVVEDPVGMEGTGLGNWVGPFERGPEGDQIMHDELFAADLVLLGRRTYEGFAAVWPTVEGEFADRLNSMPKYVASRTLRSAEWSNTTVLPDAVARVRELKAEDGGTILIYGSASVVHDLVRAGLVDRLHIMVYPTVLGRGIRLLPEGWSGGLELDTLTRLGSGIVSFEYRMA